MSYDPSDPMHPMNREREDLEPEDRPRRNPVLWSSDESEEWEQCAARRRAEHPEGCDD